MEKGKDMILFNAIAYLITSLVAIACVIPFIMLVIGSFQSEDTILKTGFSLIPKEIDFTAYRFIFNSPDKIIQSYGVSIFVTAAGTILSIFFSSMAAFAISRKDLKYRNHLALYLFFTTLFNGGLVPYYLLISKYLMLGDSIALLVLSNMFNVMFILILRTYISNSIPDSLIESAKIDGAEEFTVFFKVVFPLLKPALASIGLFIALGYWNDYFTALLFIGNEKLYPLQYLLFKILSFANFSSQLVGNNSAVSSIQLPSESLKLALTVIAAGPMILAYPSVQKYFVSGMTIGAIKG